MEEEKIDVILFVKLELLALKLFKSKIIYYIIFYILYYFSVLMVLLLVVHSKILSQNNRIVQVKVIMVLICTTIFLVLHTLYIRSRSLDIRIHL